LKKELSYFKKENITFVDSSYLASQLAFNTPKENLKRNLEKMGFVALVTFDQPIDAIRVYMKDIEISVPLNNGEEGSPVYIPSEKLKATVNTD